MQNRLRVLTVLHYPFYGGPTNRNLRLHPVLAQAGVDLRAVLTDEPGNAATRLRDAGVPTTTQRLRRVRGTVNLWTHSNFALSFWPDVLRLKRLIQQQRIDVVQINGLENPHGAIAGRLAGAAVVWQILATRLPTTITTPLMLLARLCADTLMSTGRIVATMHPGATSFGDRLVSFFPPVDCQEFNPDRVDREILRSKLKVGQDEPLVGILGNLNPQKGHEVFIQAAAMVRQHLPKARFAIIGQSLPTHALYRKKLLQLATDLGLTIERDLLIHVPEQGHVAEALASLDLFVMTSVPRSEGIPTAALEAMAMGKTVISTEVGSVREMMEDGVNGFIVPPNQPEAVAERIVWALTHPEQCRAMERLNRQLALDRFTVDQCAQQHLDAYEKAINHASERRRWRLKRDTLWRR